jgi:hypothetical protein
MRLIPDRLVWGERRDVTKRGGGRRNEGKGKMKGGR